jgi:DNA topoisomerase I
MTKYLVIVESPSKEKTIKKYLGADYTVKASKGHIVDLPKKELGVDTEKNFEPAYIVTNPAKLKELKRLFQGKSKLVLAVDPDREGEAIGWHVAQKLGVINKKGQVKPGKKIERFVFTEITKEAVQNAAKNPRTIDMNLVNAQQTRRVLDRLVGYKLSPLLWKKIRFGLSAGRVQSVAVKLIVDREIERENFKPVEFWNLDAFLNEKKKGSPKVIIVEKKIENKNAVNAENSGNEEVTSELSPEDQKVENSAKGINFKLTKLKDKKPEIKTKAEADGLLKKLVGADWIINSIDKELSIRRPGAPFKTSTLQQTAANKLGYSSKKTMRAAQKLYEAGLISYMRTDSVVMSMQAINNARDFIKANYSEKYLPEKPNIFKTKSKVAQEGHEAIRPTNFTLLPEEIKIGPAEQKVYRLIWQKALASQVCPAEVEITSISILIGDCEFEAKGEKLKFDGFLKIYRGFGKDIEIPDLKEGQELFLNELIGLQNFTEPPARYSEASLIKALEKYGIGRPSTYSSIISTILARQYVEKLERAFVPTDTGRVVTKLLEDNFPSIVDLDFTAEMEEDLDRVANGEKEWKSIIKTFYTPFEKQLIKKDKSIKREDYTVLAKADKKVKCPECGSSMLVKLGRYGRFYSCSKWPDCKGMKAVEGGPNGESAEDLAKKVKTQKFQEDYKVSPKTDDGRDYLLKRGKYGVFWAHPDYPKVKDARPLEYSDEIFKKLYGKPPKTKDGGHMILRRGRFGEFWAHIDYPKVKEVQRIDKKKINALKKEIGIEY